jgi:hypothetical protein
MDYFDRRAAVRIDDYSYQLETERRSVLANEQFDMVRKS